MKSTWFLFYLPSFLNIKTWFATCGVNYRLVTAKLFTYGLVELLLVALTPLIRRTEEAVQLKLDCHGCYIWLLSLQNPWDLWCVHPLPWYTPNSSRNENRTLHMWLPDWGLCVLFRRFARPAWPDTGHLRCYQHFYFAKVVVWHNLNRYRERNGKP